MLTLYKFRGLTSCQDFERAVQILTNGEFWCGKLWNLNDPMEGVYSFHREELDSDRIDRLFEAKQQQIICSFSGEKAFASPAMWGYYAGGFKGVAIELVVDPSEVVPVAYDRDVAGLLADGTESTDNERLRRVLTTKLEAWLGEHEYRFLTTGEPRSVKIGHVTGVHFGWPYGAMRRGRRGLRESDDAKAYLKYATLLAELAEQLDLPTTAAWVDSGKVATRPLELSEMRRLRDGAS